MLLKSIIFVDFFHFGLGRPTRTNPTKNNTMVPKLCDAILMQFFIFMFIVVNISCFPYSPNRACSMGFSRMIKAAWVILAPARPPRHRKM